MTDAEKTAFEKCVTDTKTACADWTKDADAKKCAAGAADSSSILAAGALFVLAALAF